MESNLVGPVADALSGLSETDRRILDMHFVEELNSTQIGQRLGMQPAAVRKRKERLLKALAGNEGLRALAASGPDELAGAFDDAEGFDFLPYEELGFTTH